MTALARRSPSRSAISTIAVSACGMWPVATPSRSMKLISSSVTGAAPWPRTGSRRSTRSVEALKNHSIGAPTRAIARINRATAEPMRSGWSSAIRLGTSSPRISEKYEIPITTTAMLTTWAYSAISPECPPSSRSSLSPKVAWPKVPERTAIKVTPICTVESSREGSAFNSIAAWAPGLPASASGTRRAFRAETSAISAIAKTPFTRISKRTIERCRMSIAIACRDGARRDGRVSSVSNRAAIVQRKKPRRPPRPGVICRRW